ncbi:MAG: hypothetical protein WC645_01035 [Candidatus Margulisiibacteriota bacterium]
MATVCLRQINLREVGTWFCIRTFPISLKVLLSAASSKIFLMYGAIIWSISILCGCLPFARGSPSLTWMYPKGGLPATHLPCLARAIAEAFTRSPVSSRSNAESRPMMPITTLPMAVELSRFSRTDKKSTSWALNKSIMP